ncbi:MAG: hypothetical protein QOF05_1163, partial [Sphingomonadales bacterium]|nr:hypothetical protein [Sphingomonadales bacterium]
MLTEGLTQWMVPLPVPGRNIR